MNKKQKDAVAKIMEAASAKVAAILPMEYHDMLLVEWTLNRGGMETTEGVLSIHWPPSVIKALGGKKKAAKLAKKALLQKVSKP